MRKRCWKNIWWSHLKCFTAWTIYKWGNLHTSLPWESKVLQLHKKWGYLVRISRKDAETGTRILVCDNRRPPALHGQLQSTNIRLNPFSSNLKNVLTWGQRIFQKIWTKLAFQVSKIPTRCFTAARKKQVARIILAEKDENVTMCACIKSN